MEVKADIIEHLTKLVYIAAFLVAFGFDKMANADLSLVMGQVLDMNPPHFLVIWCQNCKMVPKLQDSVASVVTNDSSSSSFDVNNLPVLNYFPLLPLDVLGGYNGTIFAYGQTASGKTHTMEV